MVAALARNRALEMQSIRLLARLQQNLGEQAIGLIKAIALKTGKGSLKLMQKTALLVRSPRWSGHPCARPVAPEKLSILSQALAQTAQDV